MAAKKLVNRPADVVGEMVEGLVAVYPGLARLGGQNVVVRADAAGGRADRVAVISGGGSGHEPAHAGYVGRGMLDAAVLGDVFTSPAPDAVLAALRASAGPPGALLVVKNYTGDRLNFGLAAELARAEGLAVEVVVVADDVALAGLPGSEYAGRRGLAGAVLVHKVAGAAAAAGLDLAEVAAEARAAAGAVATMGVALGPCTLPGAEAPGFSLGPDEVEWGLGIHGEPGVGRGPLGTADALVDRLLDALAADARLAEGDRVALLVNGLGGTPLMELAVAARRAVAGLEARGVAVERAYLGTMLSALEMPGVSLSALRVDDARLARLDAPTDAPAWPNPAAVARPRRARPTAEATAEGADPAVSARAEHPPETAAGRALGLALKGAADALLAAEDRLSALDRAVGDGDLGASLARGASTVLEALPGLPMDDPAATLEGLGRSIQAAVGGTSGPLYAVLLLRAGARMRGADSADPAAWSAALAAGCSGVIELGGAGRGDRTMLDALLPAADALTEAADAGLTAPGPLLRAAAVAAAAGAAATADLAPRRGRSSYLGDRALGHVDPGAEAVALWLRAAADALG